MDSSGWISAAHCRTYRVCAPSCYANTATAYDAMHVLELMSYHYSDGDGVRLPMTKASLPVLMCDLFGKD
jgi:hypothetical protein